MTMTMKTKNKRYKNPITGKFQKEPKPVDDIIAQVKEELYNGYFDLDRVREAYKKITGIETASVITMKKAIIAHDNTE